MNELINAEIRVYRDHVTAIKAIIGVVKTMDGKIYDKRVETAMNKAVEGYFFYTYTKYGELSIEGHNSINRSFTSGIDSLGYKSTGYVTNDTFTCRAGKFEDVFTTTDSGKWRIKASAIIPKLEECAAYNERLANDLEEAIINHDTMVKELQEIANKMIDFKHKYSYVVRELFGLNYDLEYRGSTNTKDYSIKTW